MHYNINKLSVLSSWVYPKMWIEICAYYCMRKRVLLSSLMARYELKYVLILEYEFERLSLWMFLGTSFFIKKERYSLSLFLFLHFLILIAFSVGLSDLYSPF